MQYKYLNIDTIFIFHDGVRVMIYIIFLLILFFSVKIKNQTTNGDKVVRA